ncbi:MAG: NAD(P)-dependent oxidoreductase [Cellvibrionales bacterium]|nr:NAD(P)-dependent oxidoreductase [Cellvibrionales bacterium]
MNILLTGAFGNLGLVCLEQALSQGFSVIAVDIPSKQNRQLANRFNKQCRVILTNYQDFLWLENHLQSIDAIIHLAAILPPLTETNAGLSHQVNIKLTQKIIEKLNRINRKPIFIYPSSVTVFGLGGKQPKKVTDKPWATDNYTQQKLTIESTLKESQIPYAILRIGVSVDARTLKTDWQTLKQLLNTHPDNPLEYIHPKDVARAFIQAAQEKTALRKIHLIGGGSTCQITQYDFLSTAFNALGLSLPKEMMGKQAFYTHWMDTTESQQVLRYQQLTFSDYQKDMRNTLQIIRAFIFPFRWLINPLLKYLLKKGLM